MADITTTLAQLPLLKGLGEEALAAMAGAGVPIRLATGDLLVRRGDLGDTLYLLLAGELRVRVGAPSGDAASTMGTPIVPGEVVGELALLASVPRSADVVAVEESTLLMFDRVHALALLGAHPALARRVMGQIAARLAQAAPLLQPQHQPTHESVHVRYLKVGNEAALREALATLPAGERPTLTQAGVRSVQIFQRGRTVVTVWMTESTMEGTPGPLLADTAEPATAAISTLFEEPNATQGACELIHRWVAAAAPCMR